MTVNVSLAIRENADQAIRDLESEITILTDRLRATIADKVELETHRAVVRANPLPPRPDRQEATDG